MPLVEHINFNHKITNKSLKDLSFYFFALVCNKIVSKSGLRIFFKKFLANDGKYFEIYQELQGTLIENLDLITFNLSILIKAQM